MGNMIFFNSFLTFDHLILKLNQGPLIQACTFSITNTEHIKQYSLIELLTDQVFIPLFFCLCEIPILKFQ